ncbi:MAG: tyrosine-type recombinase/integrase, partial [Candidatus Acidiferrales bacterium]
METIIGAANRRLQMLAILFAATGLRAGEMFGLEVRHFDGISNIVEQEAWGGKIQTPKTENARRTVELHPEVAKLLTSFIGGQTKGYIFPNGRGKPIGQSNFLRRESHPVLRRVGIPQCGLHDFRRCRNTYLRNVAGCPDGLLKFWLGHADQSMSDRYDKVGQGANAQFRQGQSQVMSVGFKLPKHLKDW